MHLVFVFERGRREERASFLMKLCGQGSYLPRGEGASDQSAFLLDQWWEGEVLLLADRSVLLPTS